MGKVREFWIILDTDGDLTERPYNTKKEALKTMVKHEELIRVIEYSTLESMTKERDELKENFVSITEDQELQINDLEEKLKIAVDAIKLHIECRDKSMCQDLFLLDKALKKIQPKEKP